MAQPSCSATDRLANTAQGSKVLLGEVSASERRCQRKVPAEHSSPRVAGLRPTGDARAPRSRFTSRTSGSNVDFPVRADYDVVAPKRPVPPDARHVDDHAGELACRQSANRCHDVDRLAPVLALRRPAGGQFECCRRDVARLDTSRLDTSRLRLLLRFPRHPCTPSESRPSAPRPAGTDLPQA